MNTIGQLLLDDLCAADFTLNINGKDVDLCFLATDDVCKNCPPTCYKCPIWSMSADKIKEIEILLGGNENDK